MKERNFDEMIAYFNRRVSEMDIDQDYKIELLGMVTALGYKHEKTAQQWIPVSERLPEDEYVLISKKPTKISGDKWSVAIAIRTADPRSGKIQWRDSEFGVIQDEKVLVWMPLPAPYKEGEE